MPENDPEGGDGDVTESGSAADEGTGSAVHAESEEDSRPRPPVWSFEPAAVPPKTADGEGAAELTGIATPRRSAPDAGLGMPISMASRQFAGSYGPAGKERSRAAVVALTIITLGFYALGWHFRVNREMRAFDPRMQVRPGRSAWAIAIPWLLGALTTVAGVARSVVARLGVELPGWLPVGKQLGYGLIAGVLAVPYVVVLLPFSLIAVTMTLERVRVVEDRVGTGSDLQIKPASEVWWLLLPVVGSLVLMAREQSRLNAVWRRLVPPAHSRPQSELP